MYFSRLKQGGENFIFFIKDLGLVFLHQPKSHAGTGVTVHSPSQREGVGGRAIKKFATQLNDYSLCFVFDRPPPAPSRWEGVNDYAQAYGTFHLSEPLRAVILVGAALRNLKLVYLSVGCEQLFGNMSNYYAG